MNSDFPRFRAQIEPAVAVLEDLVDQTSDLRVTAGYVPLADSPAMAEIAEESCYAGSWGEYPVTDAHAMSWLYVAAAENFAASVGVLARDEGPHVYAPIVVARAALEACGRAAWLAAPDISVRLRIARAQSDRLYSLWEASRIAPAQHVARHNARRDAIVSEAERQGFAKISTKRQPILSLEESRPGSTAVVKSLFDEEDDLGKTIYSYWSAVAHSTLFGLGASLSRDPADTENVGPLRVGAIGVKASDVVSTVRSILLGYVHAVKYQRELFGWTSTAWERTVLNAFRTLRAMTPA